MEPIKYGRKISGIKRELNKTVNKWLKSIDDEEVKQAAERDTIVTGGSIASMLLGEKVNDYDIYFRTKETAILVSIYYVDKFNKAKQLDVGDGVMPYMPTVQTEDMVNIKGELENRVVIFCKSAGVAAENQTTYEYFENQPDHVTDEFIESLSKKKDGDKYRPVFLSQNAITLSDKIQLIIRFTGEPDKIHSNYDFVHAKCFWDHSNQKLGLPNDALVSLLSRTLIYEGSLYPIASIFRMKKFIERGWRITAGQQLKIMWQISEIDLTVFDVVREQLTGVDMAYMFQLISAIKNVKDDEGVTVDSTYIAKLIDKIFE